MRKNRIFYILMLILFFWIMIMYNSWQTELIFKISVIIPVIIGAVNFFMAGKIKVYFDEREEYCQKEDSIKKYIMVDNGTMFPAARIELKVEIEDYFGHIEKRTILVNSEPHTIRNFGMDMTFHHYGIMTIRIKQIRIYDFFFLTVYKKKLNIETIIYIFPDLTKRMEFFIKSRKYGIEEDENEEFSGERRGTNRGEIIEVDEYHEGDDIRNIHWKLSSKSENFLVKHYSNATDEKVHFHINTLVDASCRYSSCDKILGTVHSLISACIANNIAFDITGYGEEGAFETDLNSLLKTIQIRQSEKGIFSDIIYNQRVTGTNIYITAEAVDKEAIPKHTVYIEMKDEPEEQKNSEEGRKQYYIEGNTMIHLNVAKQEEEKREDKVFLEPYNDKIRPHRKIKYIHDNFKYMALQSFIALLAAGMAIFSIYDVMFYGQDTIFLPLLTVSVFVFVHFLLNVIGDDMEEKKIGTIRNIIIFGGYLAILILGGVFFVFDGVSEIIEAFSMNITVSEEDYGFFEYTSNELDWLLILVTYAVADVIYNFCMEFVLSVHVLIVVPLISISMIVGYVPPMYVVLFGLIYFPAIFAVNSCITFGKKKKKKYLSDDYSYTGNVAYFSGIITIIVTMSVFVLVTFQMFWGGYHRAVWMKECKNVISAVLEEGSIKGGIRILSDLFKTDTVLTAGRRGQLDDTVQVSYTGETVLQVTLMGEVVQNRGIYLKSFVGTDYEGDSWKERSSEEIRKEENFLKEVFDELGYTEQDTAYLDKYFTEAAAFREKFTNYFARYQFANFYYVTAEETVYGYTMHVESLLKDDTNIYKPYFSVSDIDGAFGSDGFEYLSEPEEEKVQYFSGYALGNTINTNKVREIFGEYPYVAMREGESSVSEASRENLEMLIKLEKRYAEYVEENYTEVPEELQDLKDRFSNIYTIYQGQRINLVSGDCQYRTLGYEPYVQYVRQYFDENKFTYNMNITRKNDKADFISDFMARKTGYCIHFASAAVMMFRSMGIPARYAEGYFADKSTIVKKSGGSVKYDITDQSAHAWVEIYQEGLGWVPVEVTPGTQNFTVSYETVGAGEPEQNTTSDASNQQTSISPNENTTAANSLKNTTTAKKEEQTENNNKAFLSPQVQAFLKNIMIIFGIITIFLLRYQIVSRRFVNRLENKSRVIRLEEMERQLNEMLKVFAIKLEESKTNSEKAKLLCEPLLPRLSEQEALEALELLDKFRYAPKGSITMEEVDKIYYFIQKYGQFMYEQGKVHEKFTYKYIKCLYLKNK